MQNIKVIIGASYGDEGKGLTTDFFGARAADSRGTINVLTNGGPQRGHTVELADGRRHVFKHFGAAAFEGAATFYAPQFMINPMEFMREYEELCALHRPPMALMDPGCRFTTPWDMLVNQLLQEKRGLHNSCGFGIWETVLRYQRGAGISFSAFAAMSREDRLHWLRRLRDGYFSCRIRELGLAGAGGGRAIFCPGTDAELQEFFFNEELLLHFEQDCETMRLLCPVRSEMHLQKYQTVLFENAQGLLLDGNAPEEQAFTTPSTTGSAKVFQTIERFFRGAEVELCYVTRSYLTRHGDGSMRAAAGGEIPENRLGLLLPGVREDVTNRENRFQGNLRYGMMDVDLLTGRILRDLEHCKGPVRNHYQPSVMVTHLNEYAGLDTEKLARRIGTVYLSDGRTRRDVHEEAAAAAV